MKSILILGVTIFGMLLGFSSVAYTNTEMNHIQLEIKKRKGQIVSEKQKIKKADL